MRRSVSIPLAIAASLTLALSACTSNSEKQSSDASADKEGSASLEDTYDPGPLWEYMGPIWGGQEWTEEQYAEEERTREELLAQCMTDQGFEYTPVVSTPIPTEDYEAEEPDGPEWGTVEFAKEHGYGIAYGYMLEPEEIPAVPEEPVVDVDPNQAYVESLSESEQAAYWGALYGPNPTDEELLQMETGEYQWTWEKAGCSGYAQHTMHPEQDTSVWDDPDFEELMQAVDGVWQQAQDDPATTELNSAWSDCMAKATYPGFVQPSDAESSAFEQFAPLTMDSDGKYKAPDKAALEAFQQTEIALATADYQCRVDVDYDKKTIEIEHRIQQEVLDQYRDQIDAAIAKYGSQ